MLLSCYILARCSKDMLLGDSIAHHCGGCTQCVTVAFTMAAHVWSSHKCCPGLQVWRCILCGTGSNSAVSNLKNESRHASPPHVITVEGDRYRRIFDWSVQEHLGSLVVYNVVRSGRVIIPIEEPSLPQHLTTFFFVCCVPQASICVFACVCLITLVPHSCVRSGEVCDSESGQCNVQEK